MGVARGDEPPLGPRGSRTLTTRLQLPVWDAPATTPTDDRSNARRYLVELDGHAASAVSDGTDGELGVNLACVLDQAAKYLLGGSS